MDKIGLSDSEVNLLINKTLSDRVPGVEGGGVYRGCRSQMGRGG